ncbi:hypothetical protein, partial [Ferrimicrobium acidiphilum]|uniref:hypothetical protein n=1 Tax=Ferrimicrobium acidiphilum TaxID=121039 RepID=UPI0023F0907E
SRVASISAMRRVPFSLTFLTRINDGGNGGRPHSQFRMKKPALEILVIVLACQVLVYLSVVRNINNRTATSMPSIPHALAVTAGILRLDHHAIDYGRSFIARHYPQPSGSLNPSLRPTIFKKSRVFPRLRRPPTLNQIPVRTTRLGSHTPGLSRGVVLAQS